MGTYKVYFFSVAIVHYFVGKITLIFTLCLCVFYLHLFNILFVLLFYILIFSISNFFILILGKKKQ